MPVTDDLRALGGVLHQAFVTFPVSAYKTPRSRDLSRPESQNVPRNLSPRAESENTRDVDGATSPPVKARSELEPQPAAVVAGETERDGGDHDLTRPPLAPTGTFSDEVFRMCTASDNISSLLARDPAMAPKDAWHKLFGHHRVGSSGSSRSSGSEPSTSPVVDDVTLGAPPLNPLERAAKCGHWGSEKPSELFLKMYHDALVTVDGHPGRAMVSPSLMGSSGVVPLTIISTIPDIVRHMSNLIVRAEKEVILATNYWQNGEAAKFLTNAMKELSRRAGERGDHIVMKVIYDRGSVRQLVEPHYVVPEREYTGKAVGLPHSHEIPNIKLQVMNYHNPLLGTFHAKYMVVDRRVAVVQSNNIQDNDNLEMMVHFEGPIVDSFYDMALLSWYKALEPPMPSHDSPAAARGIGAWGDDYHPGGSSQRSSADEGVSGVAVGRQSGNLSAQSVVSGSPTSPSSQPVVDGNSESQQGTGTQETPTITVTREAGDVDGPAAHTGGSETPIGRSETPISLREHKTFDPHYDASIAEEAARVQASVSPAPGETPLEAITRHLNHTTNVDFRPPVPPLATSPSLSPHADDIFTPYVMPRTHQAPVPMAMVCRAPHGPPNHLSVSNPQNAAWLAALRHAKRSVFIQSPTLNAEPLLPAIIEACERGVDVVCYICLGYNDMGELLPLQGGHNEMVAHRLYAALSPAGRAKLRYHWYVGKDTCVPIVQEKRRRSCHIKLLIADEHVAVVGSGNQDTQSWFHSQEVNVLLDSAEICSEWLDALRRNQNTGLYGALNPETGIWTDAEGREADGAIGVDPGKFSWARGVAGALKRLQGKGGF